MTPYIQTTVARKTIYEHRVIAERILGRALPSKAEVHHVNGNGRDNGSNLVICEDHGYHFLLEGRSKALDACGHADWRKCWICKTWDAPSNLVIRKPYIQHAACSRRYRRNLRRRNSTQEG